jgi:hypothetical protein
MFASIRNDSCTRGRSNQTKCVRTRGFLIRWWQWQTFIFQSGKSEASCLMKRNPRKVSWTQFYRRLHKKGQQEESAKKRAVLTQSPSARPRANREP